jgi:hypothetical protein
MDRVKGGVLNKDKGITSECKIEKQGRSTKKQVTFTRVLLLF